MKNRDYKMSKLKHQVKNNRNPNKLWCLNEEEKDYLVSQGYTLTPVLFRIRTRRLNNYSGTTIHLLKTLHHAKREGKDYIVMKLTFSDKKILNEYGISYLPLKYRITR